MSSEEIQTIEASDVITPLDEKLKSIEPNETKRKAILSVVSAKIQSFTGPLPPPEILKKYEAIEKGFANRIIKMAEEQSSHRRKLESNAISSQLKQSERGQIFGLILGIIGLVGGVYLGSIGQQIAAVGLGGTTLGGLVTVFVIGKKKQKEDLSSKSE